MWHKYCRKFFFSILEKIELLFTTLLMGHKIQYILRPMKKTIMATQSVIRIVHVADTTRDTTQFCQCIGVTVFMLYNGFNGLSQNGKQKAMNNKK